MTQHEMTLRFIASNGFDVTSSKELEKALEWISTTSGDELVCGSTGYQFDIELGELRRPMLINAVKNELNKLSN